MKGKKKMAKETVKIYIQDNNGECDVNASAEKALKSCKSSTKAAIKEINVYINTNDRKAYYTANSDKINGNVDLEYTK